MSETGHAKNLANFSQVISIISGLGSAYDPNNPLIELTNLQTKLTTLQTTFTAVAPLESAETLAVNERGAIFEPLSKLVTRINSAAEVNVNDPLFSINLRTIVRKLQGRRADGQVTEEQNVEGGEPPKQLKSVSQVSFDNRTVGFFELITLLKTHGSYNPNETDLKIVTLEAMLADMGAKNTAVVDASVAAKNIRIARNDVFYNDTDGILVLVDLVKKYVKSVFGTNSPQHRQLTAFQFRKP